MKTTLLFLSVFLSVSLFGQNVYIPDANFKTCLLAFVNTNGDEEVQLSEANEYDSGIDCSQLNISDLTGIEAFTSLKYLDVKLNQLTSIDISQNTALERINIEYNQITSIDVSQNTYLQDIFCNDNQLTSIDLSQNTSLRRLDCGNNQLTSLNLSLMPDLYKLWCYGNQLNCLNVANGNNLDFFFSIYTLDNPNLTCIEIECDY